MLGCGPAVEVSFLGLSDDVLSGVRKAHGLDAAVATLQFGEGGIGSGKLNDGLNSAVDGQWTFYVAHDQDGLIHPFDMAEKYVRQCQVRDTQTILQGMAVSRQRDLFLAVDSQILHLDGKSGEVLGKMTVPKGGVFGDLAMLANGKLTAAMSEMRWGLVTSLKGHRLNLVVLTHNGNVSLCFPILISAQTGGLAVDGLGNFYTLSGGSVYEVSAAGKSLNRFNSPRDQLGQVRSTRAIAVDG
jgi:hypothetical protein